MSVLRNAAHNPVWLMSVLRNASHDAGWLAGWLRRQRSSNTHHGLSAVRAVGSLFVPHTRPSSLTRRVVNKPDTTYRVLTLRADVLSLSLCLCVVWPVVSVCLLSVCLSVCLSLPAPQLTAGHIARQLSSQAGDSVNFRTWPKQLVSVFWADIPVPRRGPLLRFPNPPRGLREPPYQAYFTNTILPQVNLPAARAEVVTVDTHDHRGILDHDQAPDETTVPVGYVVNRHVISTFVEVKPRRNGSGRIRSFTDQQRGQVIRYATSLLNSQPPRAHITCALTDCSQVEFIRVYAFPSSDIPFRIEHMAALLLDNPSGKANRYFRALLTTATYLPAIQIQGVTVDSNRRLGHSHSSQVFVVREDETRVVKVCSSPDLVANEVTILTAIQQAQPPVPRVIQLYGSSDCALVLTRCVASVDRYENAAILGGHFADLVPTFQRLHYLDIFHRDARSPNLLVQETAGGGVSLLLADFGLSIMGSGGSGPMAGAPLQYFSETMLQARRHDRTMFNYRFRPADDLHIFLRGIFLLYQSNGPFPEDVPALPTVDQLRSIDAWSAYWRACFALEPWRTMVDYIDAASSSGASAPLYELLEQALSALPEMPVPGSVSSRGTGAVIIRQQSRSPGPSPPPATVGQRLQQQPLGVQRARRRARSISPERVSRNQRQRPALGSVFRGVPRDRAYSIVYMPLLTEAAISAGVLRSRAAQLRQQYHSHDLLVQFPSAAAIVAAIAAAIPIQRTLLQNMNPRSALARVLNQSPLSLLADFDTWAGGAGVPVYLQPPVQDMFMTAGAAALAGVLPGSQQHLRDDMYDFMQQYQ